jgi:DNA-binding MarR family transcriptional regulator
MSLQAYAWAMRQPAKGASKFVLLMMADTCDPYGVAVCPREWLADKTGLLESHVNAVIASLEKDGIIEVCPGPYKYADCVEYFRFMGAEHEF